MKPGAARSEGAERHLGAKAGDDLVAAAGENRVDLDGSAAAVRAGAVG